MSKSLVITAVPKVKPTDQPKVKITGNGIYSFQQVQQALQQAATITVGTFTREIPEDADPAAPTLGSTTA